MIVWSLVIAAFSAIAGHAAALTVPRWFGFADTSTSGMMAVIAGLVFMLVAVLAPKHGWIARRFQLRAKKISPSADSTP